MDGPRRRRMIRGTIQRTGDLAMRYGSPPSQLAPLVRALVMRRLIERRRTSDRTGETASRAAPAGKGNALVPRRFEMWLRRPRARNDEAVADRRRPRCAAWQRRAHSLPDRRANSRQEIVRRVGPSESVPETDAHHADRPLTPVRDGHDGANVRPDDEVFARSNLHAAPE